MKEKLIAMLKAAGVSGAEKVAEEMMKDSINGKILIDDGKDNVFVPKSRLDSEIDKKKKMKDSLDTATQTIKDLEKDIKGNAEALKKVEEYKTAAEKAEKDLETFTRNQAISEAINSFESKPHDISAVLALLDQDAVVVKDGKVLGLEEQLKKMATEKAFLFKTEEGEGAGKGTGNPGNPGAGAGVGGAGKYGGSKESVGSILGKQMTQVSTSPKTSFFN